MSEYSVESILPVDDGCQALLVSCAVTLRYVKWRLKRLSDARWPGSHFHWQPLLGAYGYSLKGWIGWGAWRARAPEPGPRGRGTPDGCLVVSTHRLQWPAVRRLHCSLVPSRHGLRRQASCGGAAPLPVHLIGRTGGQFPTAAGL